MSKQVFIRTLPIAAIALLLPIVGRAQNPPPQEAASSTDKISQQFWQLADTLRPKLDEWKSTVDGFDFNQLKMGKEGEVILHTLEGDKQQCLHSLTALWLQIPNVEKMQGASMEVRTTLQVVFLHNQLVKLQSDLNIALAQALASGSMTFNDPQSQTIRGWSGKLSEITSDLGNDILDHMQMQMTRHLTLVDVELTQCRAQRPSNP